MKKSVLGRFRGNIVSTVVASVLLCVVFIIMMEVVYIREEQECYENLHIQTKQFKDDLRRRMNSDRDTLSLVASYAAEFYENNRDLGLIFRSYEPTGLIENVGILMPDDTFITKKGVLDFNGKLSFAEESAKGAYMTGRVTDVVDPTRQIIRVATPIISKDRTVGILYGSMNLRTLSELYKESVEELDAQLYVYEDTTKNLIIDTFDSELGNIGVLKDREYEEGYSYEKMMSEEKGFSIFISKFWNEKMYIHYSPLEINDWKIMLARRQTHVFEKANYISVVLYASLIFMAAIIVVYFMVLLSYERGKKHISTQSSQIRKLLLEINQNNASIKEALEKIAVFSNSRSAVFVDTDGEDYNFIFQKYIQKLLIDDDRTYFISEIFGYAAKLHIKSKKAVNVAALKVDSDLEKSNPKFYEFLKKHDIAQIAFASVTDKNNHISVLCILNPKKIQEAKSILADIAVCFSIAIFNKKHLNKTEIAASTDSLTGLLNRVTYKKEIKDFDEEMPEDFACLYVDVNELHLRNNKYGHAAGDEMLIYIANTLKEVFYGHHIYRMGGDEFLVFTEKMSQEDVKKAISDIEERLLPKDYHIAVGMSYRTRNTNTEEMVQEAEKRMYEAKAQYYQNKEITSASAMGTEGYKTLKTGIGEIDTLLTAMKDRYNGIYKVSLHTDEVKRILMPSYLGYEESEKSFGRLLTKYIEDSVSPDFHRALFSFMNYDALKRQLLGGNIPRITYKKISGENIVLSVYPFNESENDIDNTLWVFEKI